MSGSGAWKSAQREEGVRGNCRAQRLKRWMEGDLGRKLQAKIHSVIPDTSEILIRVKTESITGTQTQRSPGPLKSNYCLLSCQAWCFGEESICHRWCQVGPLPKKEMWSYPLSEAARKVFQPRENACHMVAFPNTGFDLRLYKTKTLYECLFRAIASICWVKVASVSPAKCRAVILTLLWCYFEEGLRRSARAFSSQSSH